jgi:GTP-binding protein
VIVDEIRLYLQAGQGGNGGYSFFRKRGVFVGDGGRGGQGADIVLRINEHLYDLKQYKYRRKFTAPSGKRGGARNKNGHNAPPLILDVPCGTLVRDSKGTIIVDLNNQKQEYIIARGGSGGQGNYKREEAETGHQGDAKEIILDYRIPCDVAIVGFANAGKTSLFNYISGKDYKVAAYAFTTTHCAWAVCEYEFKRFTLLDTPPCQEEGGLHPEEYFLKHLFRAKIILIVTANPQSPDQEIKIIQDKLVSFDKRYRDKKTFYLLNKVDKIDYDSQNRGYLAVSSKKRQGAETLVNKIIAYLYNKNA